MCMNVGEGAVFGDIVVGRDIRRSLVLQGSQVMRQFQCRCIPHKLHCSVSCVVSDRWESCDNLTQITSLYRHAIASANHGGA